MTAASRAAKLRDCLVAVLSIVSGNALADSACTRRTPTFAQELRAPETAFADVRAVMLQPGAERTLLAVSDTWKDGTRYTSMKRIEVAAGVPLHAVTLSDLPPVGAPDWNSWRTWPLLSGDFDGDSRTDLVVCRTASSGSGGFRADLLLGEPDGALGLAASLETTTYVSARPVAGDFDADGRDELFFAGVRTGFLYRVVAGAWQLATAQPVDHWSEEPAVIDLDGDGVNDVAWADGMGLLALVGNAEDPLARRRFIPVDFRASGPIAPFDADGEGEPELLVGESTGQGFPSGLRALQRDSASGAFRTLWNAALPDGVARWTPFDLDADGVQDIVLSFYILDRDAQTWIAHESAFQLLSGRGAAPPLFGQRSQGLPQLVDVREADGDGVPDAILLPVSARPSEPGGRGLVVYRGTPGPWFAEPLLYQRAAPGRMPMAGDVDEDGTLDLVSWIGYGFTVNGASHVLLGRGDGSFIEREGPAIRPAADRVDLRDLDGDGHLDLVNLVDTDYDQRRGIFVSYGVGDGHFASPAIQGTPGMFATAAYGDLDGDGRNDVLLGNPYLYPYRYLPAYVYGRHWDTSSSWLDLSGEPVYLPDTHPLLVDVDENGLADVVYVTRDGSEQRTLVWRPTLRGRMFDAPRPIATWSGDFRALQQVDVDSDGSQDLILQYGSGDERTTWVLRSDGAGRFRTLSRQTVSGPEAVGNAVALDVDGDGELDLASALAGIDLRHGLGDGRFASPSATWFSERDAVLGDLDADGLADAAAMTLGVEEYRLASALDMPTVPLEDAGPPLADIHLQPLIGDALGVPAFGDEWMVTFTLEDECDAQPRPLTRHLDLGSIAADAPVLFRASAEPGLRFYEDPADGWMIVVLAGPDETSARRGFAAARAAGGFALAHHGVIRLRVVERFGPEPERQGDAGLVPASFRLVRRMVFAEQAVRSCIVTRPGGDVTFTLTGRDAAGHESTATARFLALRGAYCSGPEAVSAVCGDL